MAIYTCGSGCNPAETPYKCTDHKPSYEGCVLSTWENNGYSDSDFVAAVWDSGDGKVKTITYATTRCWTYHNNAVVDATDEVRSKAKRWLTMETHARSIYRAQEEAKNPTVGKTVKSLTTRGKNKGVIGTIVAREVNPYNGPYYANGYNDPNSIYNQRVKVQIHGENVMRWLSADKVEVIDPEPVDSDALLKSAEQWAEQESYISVFSRGWHTA